MDGAASVITVVGLALHSTQVVYQTVSGIKQAPRTLQHLTSNLRNLSNVLQQLNGFGDDLYLASELPQLVAACAKYMREFEAKVSKLCSPKDKKVARLWKNVKATLQEDEIDRMSALLQQHFAVLSLQMNVIKGKRLERIENCSNRQATLSATHTTILENTRTGVDQISTILADLQTISQASTQGLSDAVDAVGDKVLNVANLSTEQSVALNTRMDSILELLKRLEPSRISQHREAKTAPHEAVRDRETDEQKLKPSNSCLEGALNRLSNLVKEKEQTLSSTEADSIIEDVDKILAHLLKAEEHYNHHDARKKRRRACDDSHVLEMQHQHDVEGMKRILKAEGRIALEDQVGQCQHVADKRFLFKTTCRVRSSSNGVFMIKARRGFLAYPTSHNIIPDSSADDLSESFEVSVTYTPKNTPKAYIAFALSQRTFLEGCYLRTPVLSVSAMIPNDSEVFQVIINGDLDRLMRMLALRQASLTDRDTEGRCLLNVSRTSKPQVIPQEVIATNDPADLVTIHALHLCDGEFYDEDIDFWKILNDSDSLPKVNECRQQLLEAGADPTISTPNNKSPAWRIIAQSRKVMMNYFHSDQCSDSDKDSLATLLNHGFELLLSEVDPRFIMAWLIAEGGWTLEGIDFILQLSGSRLPVQNLDSALRNAIGGSWGVDEGEFLQVLILLMKNGADMTGGHLVSKYASNPRTLYRMRDMYSHEMYVEHRVSIVNRDLRLRHIWAKALAACGYHAEGFISQSTRLEELLETDEEGFEFPYGEEISTAEYFSRAKRFEELSKIYDEGSEDQSETTSDEDDSSTPEYKSEGFEDQSATILDEDDASTAEEPAQPPELNDEAFDGASASETDDISEPSNHLPYSYSDCAVLEEDAFVWRD